MGILSYRQKLPRLRLTTLLERRMRGDVIETFKIINGFVNYGHNMFGTNTAYIELVILISLLIKIST